jgi:tetratricopeptide (TPR) repeat protein
MNPVLQQAMLLVQQGRLDLAEQKLRLFLAESPNEPLAYSLLGECALQQKKYTEATDFAKQAIGLDPSNPYFYARLGHIWIERRYWKEAAQAIDQAVQLDPENGDWHSEQAYLLYQQNHFQDSIFASERALALDPDNTQARNLRSECLRRLGHTDQSEEAMRETLGDDPHNAMSHAVLGWNLLQQNKRAAAKTHFLEALRIDPELKFAQQGLLEVIRAGNPLYRWVLGFAFWINRWPPRAQAGLILGGFFGNQLLQSFARQNPDWAWLVLPVIIAYLVFCFLTIFIKPLTDALLVFHPLGRLIMSPDERRNSYLVAGACALTTVAVVLVFFSGEESWAGSRALSIFSATVTLAATVMLPAPWPRRWMWFYFAAFGLSTLLFIVCTLNIDWTNQSRLLVTFCNRYQDWLTWNILISTVLPSVLVNLPQRRD